MTTSISRWPDTFSSFVATHPSSQQLVDYCAQAMREAQDDPNREIEFTSLGAVLAGLYIRQQDLAAAHDVFTRIWERKSCSTTAGLQFLKLLLRRGEPEAATALLSQMRFRLETQRQDPRLLGEERDLGNLAGNASLDLLLGEGHIALKKGDVESLRAVCAGIETLVLARPGLPWQIDPDFVVAVRGAGDEVSAALIQKLSTRVGSWNPRP